MRDLNIFLQERPDAVFGLRQLLFFYIFIRNSLFTDMEDCSMDELNPTVREQEMYEEIELTPGNGEVHPYPLRDLSAPLRGS